VRYRRAAILVLTTAALGIGALELFCQKTLKVRRRIGVPIVSASEASPSWNTVAILARDHIRLEASFIAPEQSNGNCVLLLHGIGAERSSMRRLAALFLSSGYRVLTPDSRASGQSGGDLITYGLLEKFDALDWAYWLRSAGCRSVYALGESLGASVLIQAAGLIQADSTEPPFRSIVVECPFSDLKSVGEARLQLYGHLPEWAGFISKVGVRSAMLYARARFGVDLSMVSPIEDIAHIQVPIFLIHGLADIRTPPSNSEVLRKAAPHAVLWLVPGAPHVGAFSAAPEEFSRRVLAWFART